MGSKPSTSLPNWTILLSALIPIIWIINLIALFSLQNETRGTFGDMFGAANSIFTGAALVALIISITLQKQEVGVAQKELQTAQKTLSEQQSLTIAQQNYLAEQSVESTFFNMLSLLMDVVNNMDLSSQGEVTTTGKDVFHVLALRVKGRGDKAPKIAKDRLLQRKAEAGKMSSSKNIPDTRISSEEIYEEIYKSFRNDLGHYFRLLYNIIKFLKFSESNKKEMYIDLLRAQLSDDELILIFLNGLSMRGSKMKLLIEEFGLLRHLDTNDDTFLDAEGKFDESAYL
ncbi:Putative phage abortive infection protein [Cohaesibacter marisflavi]|uniref:Putative phage abortive infection protein n=1 Tax=Cohaesibacter marisflavi TaxID=655353 RepID=A0A1I5H909_9HYPH|nr:putative phage abortive infection protein [Cohaesibacter marisflavi]SFO44755.1 Putative phage abortive infection protein [Cohaesibacter marisflavi]